MITSHELDQFALKAQSLHTSPSLMVDRAIIQDKCRIFATSFPDISLFYALKCFSNASVIDALDGLVDGYDVASVSEIETLLNKGVDPSRLRYSNPVKSLEFIRQAFQYGVDRFAFQSDDELRKISHAAPGSQVYLRIDVASAKKSIDFSSKFGVPREQASRLIGEAIRLGLVPTGVTFHVGSQAEDVDAWVDAIASAGNIVREVQDRGITLSEINIGGGFPVQYTSSSLPIGELATAINGAIGKLKKEFPQLTFMAEPGRFLVAESGVIATKVIGKEVRGGKEWLFLDTGTFQSFMEIFEFNNSFFYPVFSLKHLDLPSDSYESATYALTGPTCDSYDTLTQNIVLPSGIEVDDTLLIGMTGAYTLAYGSQFNGFNIPSIVFLENVQETEYKDRALDMIRAGRHETIRNAK